MPRFLVRFKFRPQERLDLRGVIIDECGGMVITRTWEHAVIEAAARQHRALAPAILAAIARGDYEVCEDEGGDPRRDMGVKRAGPPAAAPGPF